MKVVHWSTLALSVFALVLCISDAQADIITLGSKTYLVELKKMSWFEAMEFCTANDMHLLTFESEKERTLLLFYLLYKEIENRYYWTSGNDLGEARKFVWETNGKAINSSDWSYGEPNNFHDPEHCVQTWRNNLKLNDIPCDDKQTDTICEKVNDEEEQ